MHTGQYTADSVCRAMGLPSFIEPDWLTATGSFLRLLLQPSFHPEVCITLAQLSDAVEMSVVVLKDMLWREESPRRLVEYGEKSSLPAEAFIAAALDFQAAYADFDANRPFICIDGLGVECCLANSGRVWRFGEHAYRPAVVGLVSGLVKQAWEVCSDPRVKNRLANCTGIKLPRQPEPPSLPRTQVFVLGTPENRADYFRLLRERLDRD